MLPPWKRESFSPSCSLIAKQSIVVAIVKKWGRVDYGPFGSGMVALMYPVPLNALPSSMLPVISNPTRYSPGVMCVILAHIADSTSYPSNGSASRLLFVMYGTDPGGSAYVCSRRTDAVFTWARFSGGAKYTSAIQGFG